MAAERGGILAGRVALVTGAGQGSGRGCAVALAAEGAKVAVVGRTQAKLDAVVAEIEACGGVARAIPCDVGHPEQIARCVDEAVAELGGIGILINAAQSPIFRSHPLLETEPGIFDELWRTGPQASLEFMRRCHPHMKSKGSIQKGSIQTGGSIVNFGTGAQAGPKDYGPYAAAKAAIAMLTRAAAEEWGPVGIRANLVVPFVESPASHEDLDRDPARREALVRAIPLQRQGRAVEDLGRVVVFLAGPDSSYVTGATLPVDGGLSFL